MKPYTPHEYQKIAIKFLLQNARGALWLDPGLGKTSTTFAAFSLLKRKKLTKAMLVVAPLKVVYHVWPKERSKWKDFNWLTLKILHGPKKAQRLREEADVYLINYEGLTWLAEELNKLKWTKAKMPFDMIVFDESSKMKNSKSMRFRLMKGWINDFKRVVQLTGTPAPNGLQDVWSQVYLLDQGKSLGRYITWFRDNYFNQVGFGGFKYVPKHGAQEKIYSQINHLVLRMDAKDWLELPPLIKTKIEVDMPAEALARYDQLVADLVLKLDDKTLTMTNAAVAVNKCLQYASGAVYTDVLERTWEVVHDAKLDALEDLVDELGGKPLLVAYNYQHDLARLQQRFPGTPHIGSGVKEATVMKILEQWGRGELPLLFGQPQSMAHGLNMQEGPAVNICFFSLIWDLEAYVQFIARLWRQGQTQRVVVHHILTNGTVDKAVMKALNRKQGDQEALLNSIKELNAGVFTDDDDL